MAEAGVKKLAMTEVLADGDFKLHKWNSNERELEDGEKLAVSVNKHSQKHS